uniref:Uncharacterized protein n=1 Tax=Siphoviridae sp. ctNEy24 TaxID=2825466 RepID=A0A8S5U0N2_9CAUD|nr:MAG TPA: hypothetical protein [Siphoviridae sp. ctNEy24]
MSKLQVVKTAQPTVLWVIRLAAKFAYPTSIPILGM